MKLPMAAFLAHQLPTVGLDHHQKLFYFDRHCPIISQPILSLHNAPAQQDFGVKQKGLWGQVFRYHMLLKDLTPRSLRMQVRELIDGV